MMMILVMTLEERMILILMTLTRRRMSCPTV